MFECIRFWFLIKLFSDFELTKHNILPQTFFIAGNVFSDWKIENNFRCCFCCLKSRVTVNELMNLKLLNLKKKEQQQNNSQSSAHNAVYIS